MHRMLVQNRILCGLCDEMATSLNSLAQSLIVMCYQPEQLVEFRVIALKRHFHQNKRFLQILYFPVQNKRLHISKGTAALTINREVH